MNNVLAIEVERVIIVGVSSTVTVPDLVGMSVHVARSFGHEHGVIVTSADLDGPPLGALTWPGIWIVTAQRPTAGTEVPRRSVVVIEFEEGGGEAGDREPLRPRPDPRAMRAARRPGDDVPGELSGG